MTSININTKSFFELSVLPLGIPKAAEPEGTSTDKKVANLALQAITHQSSINEHKEHLILIKRDLEILKRLNPGHENPITISILIKGISESPFIKDQLEQALRIGSPNKNFELSALEKDPNILFNIKDEEGKTLFKHIEDKINALITIIENESSFCRQSPTADTQMKIDQLRKEFDRIKHTPFPVFECPPYYSSKIASIHINNSIIFKILEMLDTGYNDKALNLIRRLDKESILFPLYHLLWEIDGRSDGGDTNYGLHAIEKNPRRLLYIKDTTTGKDILTQIKDHLKTTLEYEKKVHFLDMLQQANSEEQARSGLLIIKSHSEELFNQICFELYQSDKKSNPDNPELTNIKYGEHKLESDIGILLNETGKSLLNKISEKIRTTQPATLSVLVKQESRYNTAPERIQQLVRQGKNLSIAMLSAEFKGVVSDGGLGEAVLGMASALQSQGNTITVIMPRYDDAILPKEIKDQLTKEPKYTLTTQKRDVYQIQVGNKAHPINVLMIDDPQYFTVGTNHEGTANKIYGSMSRFIQFQKLAAELCQKLYTENEVEVIHLQDSQTALVPTMLRHTAGGIDNTPPVVFTFHNNGLAAQCCYRNTSGDSPQTLLNDMGLGMDPRNAFVEGIKNADAVTTVSSKFAEEACFGHELERNVGAHVRQALYEGKLFSVLNGINTSAWDPKKNSTLKDWTCVDCLDFNGDEIKLFLDGAKFNDKTPQEADQIAKAFIETVKEEIASGKKVKIDLSYGKEDHPLYIACKKELCKIEVAKYLKKYKLGNIDPAKPLLLNIGRFDASQKGTGKIPLIIHLVKEADAQIICIGLDGDTCPDMKQMTAAARYHNNGAIIIQDVKVNGKIKWQVGHTDPETKANIPGFGPLLRAAADIGVFPSEYEPCGLVQGESFIMGVRALTTDTGGFHDTVFKDGDRKNGWLFNRSAFWISSEQDEEIKKVIPLAIKEVQMSIYSDNLEEKMKFYEQTKVIMHNAELMDWTQKHPSEKMTPVEKLQAVYAFAQKMSRRSHQHFSLENASAI